MLMDADQNPAEMQEVFERVSNYFSLLGEPMRLRILYALCDGERAVTDIMERIGSTQANASRHLNLLYRAKILARRKLGTQVYYRIQDQNALKLCKTVCAEITSEMSHARSSLTVATESAA
jgi:DNA-binding transcriptional ArsR family regulator